MKLRKLALITSIIPILSGCGLGPVEITGCRADIFTCTSGMDKREQVKEETINADGTKFKYYTVKIGQPYIIEIYPVWKGSRVPRFEGDCATFSESEYWKIRYKEDQQQADGLQYVIIFHYPYNKNVGLQKLEYSVGEFSNSMTLCFEPYSVPVNG